MKISIITICFNSEKDIRATIESVLNQTYHDIEYIIKDGGSKDSTVAIANEYKEQFGNVHGCTFKVISCKDKGIYDAINQGIEAATGDVVGLIHAGDRLYDNNAIKKIARFFETNKDLDISYGNSKIVDDEGKVIRVNKSPNYKRSLIRKGWFPSHQSIYTRKEIFDKFGKYDTNVGWAADYQWFIRLFYVQKLNIKLLDEFIVRFSTGGTSTKSYKSRFTKAHREMMENCWRTNGVEPPMGIVYWQLFRKIKQLLLAKIGA